MMYSVGEFLFYIFKRSKHTTMKLFISFILLTSWGFSQVTDIDGNTYKTVKIGNQEWMAENLKVTHYNDGAEIPIISSSNFWAQNHSNNLQEPMAIKYSEKDYKGVVEYPCGEEYFYPYKHNGIVYNYYVVEKGNVCPVGWHIPEEDELKILFKNTIGEDVKDYDSRTDLASLNDTDIPEKLSFSHNQKGYSATCNPKMVIGPDGGIITNDVVEKWTAELKAMCWSGFNHEIWLKNSKSLMIFDAELKLNGANTNSPYGWVDFNPNKYDGLDIRCLKD